MKKIVNSKSIIAATVTVLFLFVCAGILPVDGNAADFYISVNGSDNNSGTKETPFASLERARQAVRSRKRENPKEKNTVILEPGIYPRTQTFLLTAEDSGLPEQPVTYRAADGGKVSLNGGIILSGFEPVIDQNILRRLDDGIQGKVVQINLRYLGINNFGDYADKNWFESTGSRIALYFDGQPMPIARWPNDEWAWIERMAGELALNPVDGQMTSRSGAFYAPAAAYVRKDHLILWQEEPQLMANGFWFYDWAHQCMPVNSVDAQTGIISLRNPEKHSHGYRSRQRFYIYNALCELDAPGEWYLDSKTGVLYFYPPGPLDKAAHKVELAMLATPLVKMENASHIILRNLTLEAGRKDAISVAGGEDDRIIGCTVRNFGQNAINVLQGQAHGIIGCDIYNIGETGIILNGGDKKKLIPAGHYAINNNIHNYATTKLTYRPGIKLMGVGNQAAHNLIHDAPHFGIYFLGNDHIIEFNEIHSVNLVSADTGAIYAGRDWTTRGNIIRHNYLHDMEAEQVSGIYLDDMFSSADVVGNVFYKLSTAVLLGGGHDNKVVNNIFVDSTPSILVDARGKWPANQRHINNWLNEWKTNGTISGVAIDKPPYSDRYPNLAAITHGHFDEPEGTVITGNISWGGSWIDINKAVSSSCVMQTNNLIGINPLFVADGKRTFQLQKDSPALELGFQQIPFLKIGLVNDGNRASWPVANAVIPNKNVFGKKPALPVPVFAVNRISDKITLGEPLVDMSWTASLVPMMIEQNTVRSKTQPASRVWLCHDGDSLFIAAEIPVKSGNSIRCGNKWGEDDAIEIAINCLEREKDNTLVLRGYASGHFECSQDAGASEKAMALARKGVKYGSQVVKPELWQAGWRIPASALGIDLNKATKLKFNFTVRKTGENLWQMWVGTYGHSFDVNQAGIIELFK